MLLHMLNVITAYSPNKLSKKIKKQTKTVHDHIESHPFFMDLINKDLPDYKYALYLQNLSPIYKSVEMFLFQNNMSSDIVQSKKVEDDIRQYRNHLNLNFDLPQFKFNAKWLQHFFSKDDFFKKTELYVRWLADMYGGQIIKRYLRYGSKYDFHSVRHSIQTVRRHIEKDLNESNVDQFIVEVNKTYEFHIDLVNNVYACTEESLQDAQV